MQTAGRILIALGVFLGGYGVMVADTDVGLLFGAICVLLLGLGVTAFSKTSGAAPDDPPDDSPGDVDDSCEQTDAPPTPLCPGCMAPVERLQDSCDICGTPLTYQAGIDPVQQIRLVGATLGTAAANPKGKIVLIGMWCIFVIPVVLMIFAMVQSSNPTGHVHMVNDDGDIVWGKATPPPMTPRRILQFAFLSGIMLLYVAIVIKTTRNYFRKKAQANHQSAYTDNTDDSGR
ncbi:MAG: hypothetical protein GY794_13195 [bacterium]|nr:hypothetical protein [bacterium]